jgi:Ni,Fe-hydrogenase III small subunit
MRAASFRITNSMTKQTTIQQMMRMALKMKPQPEYVVLKGNCIRHDGEIYRENLRIPVSGKDAERLLAAGVIADVQVLRQRALSAARGVKITTE